MTLAEQHKGLEEVVNKSHMDKDARELKDHIDRLGEFRSKIDITAESFTKVESIYRWDLLINRYKKQYMP